MIHNNIAILISTIVMVTPQYPGHHMHSRLHEYYNLYAHFIDMCRNIIVNILLKVTVHYCVYGYANCIANSSKCRVMAKRRAMAYLHVHYVYADTSNQRHNYGIHHNYYYVREHNAASAWHYVCMYTCTMHT